MGQPAARLSDMHVCPQVTVLVPHVGGPIVSPGAPTVLIGGLPAARVGDMAACTGPPDFIAPPGAPTVLIGGMPAARMGDMTVHGGSIVLGCFTVLIGPSGSGGSGLGMGTPVKLPMDTTKYPDERKFLESPKGKATFPALGSDFEVLGPSTPTYNCISHTLDDSTSWTNPETGPSGDPLSEMDKIYAAKGYKRSSTMDFSEVPGKQKVVVYAKTNPDGSIVVTHGAIQDGNGGWTSKLGQGPLVRHNDPGALNGPVYGKPVAVYER